MFDSQKDDKKIKTLLPFHTAIIMDGNSRWAQKRGKSPIFGHTAGVQSVKKAIKFAIYSHLKVLTLYAFSSENWKRPVQEVTELMKLFIFTLNKEISYLNKYNIRLQVIGDCSILDIQLQEEICRSESSTEKNNGLILNIAFNYGGRWDIVQGVKKLATQVKQGLLHPEQINENTLCKVVCMNKMPDVDFVIRTGGEYRISNFLLWQIAYSELFFTDILWPDFNEDIFCHALNVFKTRKRRFGTTSCVI